MKNTYEGIASEGKNQVLFRNVRDQIVIGGSWLKREYDLSVERIRRNQKNEIEIHFVTVLEG